MKDHNNDENRRAVSRWENEGGTRRHDAGRRTGKGSADSDKRRASQERLDTSHQSDTRGEHRYDDVHQTGAEQEARQERDDLKKRLGRRVGRRAG
jgi:hypothetical protein